MDGKKKAKTVPARSWFGAWRRKRRAAQPDFADMGTAFGLELSLNQKLLDDMLPPAPTPAPRTWRKGWVQRLAQRRAAP